MTETSEEKIKRLEKDYHSLLIEKLMIAIKEIQKVIDSLRR